MMPQPVERSKVLGQFGGFFNPVNGSTLYALRSASAGENKTLFFPFRCRPGGVLVAACPALLFLFEKIKLLFQECPHWWVHWHSCILAALRPGYSD